MLRIFKNLMRHYPVAVLCTLLFSVIFMKSCANTTTPPSGGVKDTIPPVLLYVEPQNLATNVSRDKGYVKMTFDEYVVVKTASDIFLSPPMEKKPVHKIRGKSIIVSFDGKLDSNRTYVLDMGQSVADNNEGNIYPGFVIAFSTGNTVDSMYLTGTVSDCNTLAPFKGATVGLYISDDDSVVFKERPVAAAKADDWGFFAIRNIKDTLYRMYAFNDLNNDNVFNPESEEVAFIDSLVRPTKVVADNILELFKLDMKDTLACLTRQSDYELAMFKEATARQYLVNKERTGEKTFYITFSAPYTQIDSLWFEGIPQEKVITQFNDMEDSLLIWINDGSKVQPDSLWLNVNYMKTDDSLKIRVPTTERIGMHKSRAMIQDAKRYKRRDEMKAEDTATVYKVSANGETFDQDGFIIDFTFPLVEAKFDSLQMILINPRQEESPATYTVVHDTMDLRRYRIYPEKPLQKGYECQLKIPYGVFFDINRMPNDSSKTKVSLPTSEDLSTLYLSLKDMSGECRYIVELMNEKRDKAIRRYEIRTDTTLVFPYIKEGMYSVRITEDLNNNGIVDTGILLEKKQPEKVKFLELSDGNSLITIPPAMEIEQEVNIKEMFK